MAIKHEEWKKVLSAVNDDKDLNKGNVVEKIQGKLKAEGKGEYEKWERASFDVDYLFAIKDDTFIVYDQFTLLHLAAKNGHADVVNALIKKRANVNAISKSGIVLLEPVLKRFKRLI